VRGFLTRRSDNRFDNTVFVAQHVVVPEAQNKKTVRLKIGRSFRIAIAAFGMLSAIEFDNQPCRLAAKIHDIRPDRHLPAKFQSLQAAVAQAKPQGTLSIRLIAP
jgi:hypothetical protein